MSLAALVSRAIGDMRSARERVSREQCQRASAEYPEDQEQAHAADGVVERGLGLGVLEDGHGPVEGLDVAGHHAIALGLADAVAGLAQVGGVRRHGSVLDQAASQVEDPDHGSIGRRRLHEVGRSWIELDPVERPLGADVVGQLLRARPQVVVEVRAHPRDRDHLHEDREEQEDHERQSGRGDRQPPADRELVEAVHAARSTYPAPRTVCRTRGSPPASSLRRRLETNTSTVLVSTRTW